MSYVRFRRATAFIPPDIAPFFPNPPGGGSWDPDGGTIGTDPIVIPGTTDPAPYLIPSGSGPITLIGSEQAAPNPLGTGCVGWRYEMSLQRSVCVSSGAELAFSKMRIVITTANGGDVIIDNVFQYYGGTACNNYNAGAAWGLQTESIVGGSEAANWTVATNCKGNGSGTSPGGQTHKCCAFPQDYNLAVWRYVYSCAFQTGGGAGAKAVSARYEFTGAAYPWGFGTLSMDLT